MAQYICPHCQKPVEDDEALLCLYCGESLNRRKHKFIIAAVAILVLLSFILFMVK